jgi:hypothetical protein
MALPDYIYSTSAVDGVNEPMYGKFLHPIKALIEEESNSWKKKDTVVKSLFNVEESHNYRETIMGQSTFSTFDTKNEGEKAGYDTVAKTFDTGIEHVAFAKSFVITREMMDDSKIGISSDIKKVTKNFIASYYRTQIALCCKALANGTNESMTFGSGNKEIPLKTGDKLPVFHKAHPYFSSKLSGKTQSNYFNAPSGKPIEEILNALTNKIRNFKDENEECLSFVADTVIIPCNQPALETKVKVACGSERTTGSANNDINIQYGNWTVVVLEGWETTGEELIVMSSDANKELSGNMFFNRVKLDIRNKIDDETRNFLWNGYCRFGVGFGSWKHIARCTISAENANATDLF